MAITTCYDQLENPRKHPVENFVLTLGASRTHHRTTTSLALVGALSDDPAWILRAAGVHILLSPFSRGRTAKYNELSGVHHHAGPLFFPTQ